MCENDYICISYKKLVQNQCKNMLYCHKTRQQAGAWKKKKPKIIWPGELFKLILIFGQVEEHISESTFYFNGILLCRDDSFMYNG